MQGRLCFVGVLEAVDVLEAHGSHLAVDQAQRAAGLDGGELAVVADEAHVRAVLAGDGVQGGEALGAGHACLVDDQDVAGADLVLRGRLRLRVGGQETVDGGRFDADRFRDHGCRGGGGGEADHAAAAVLERGRGQAQRGRLAGASGADADHELTVRRGELACEIPLAGVERAGVLGGRALERVTADGGEGASPRGVEELVLGVEDPRRREQGLALVVVDARSVRPRQRRERAMRGRGSERHRLPQGGAGDLLHEGFRDALVGDQGGEVPACFRLDDVGSPYRVMLFHGAEDLRGDLVDVDARGLLVRGCEGAGGVDEAGGAVGADAGDGGLVDGLGGADVVLLRPGLQGRLLRDGDEGLRVWRAAVVALVLLDEPLGRRADGGGAGGERVDQVRVDARDLHHRPLAGGGDPGGRRDPEPAAHLGHDGGVVELRRGHVHAVQELGVDGAPLAVYALDLVRDHDVVVQLRVPVPGVVVTEHGRRDAALDLDLRDPVGTGTGGDRLALEVADRVAHGPLLGRLDRLPGVRVTERPEHGDALRRGAHEVEPGDRSLVGAGSRGDELPELLLVRRLPPLRVAERLRALAGADEAAFLRVGLVAVEALERVVAGLDPPLQSGGSCTVGVVRAAELGALLRLLRGDTFGESVGDNAVRVRVQPLTVEGLHLLLGDRPRDAEDVGAATHPPSGRVAVDGVVVAELAVAIALRVAGGDLARVVGVPVPGGEDVHCHHAERRRGHSRTCRRRVAETAIMSVDPRESGVPGADPRSAPGRHRQPRSARGGRRRRRSRMRRQRAHAARS